MKTFEEFIREKANRMYPPLEAAVGGITLTNSHVLEALAEITAKHLLVVAEEWCKKPHGMGDFYNSDEVVTMCFRGDAVVARKLLEYLHNYISGAQTEGGEDGE